MSYIHKASDQKLAEIERLRASLKEATEKIKSLEKQIERFQDERAKRTSRDCAMDEVSELMDCIHSDHTFEDLDKHTPARMQTTTGSIIAWLMHRCHQAETIARTTKAND